MPSNYETVKKSIQKKRSVVIRIKEETPCADCGNYYPYYVMDFDHLEGEEKSFNISAASYRKSLDVILGEIEKCDVVCSNCHRTRTQERRAEGWYPRSLINSANPVRLRSVATKNG